MKKYKKELLTQLMRIRPDFTISTLGRDIDFITSIKDGSKKNSGSTYYKKQYS